MPKCPFRSQNSQCPESSVGNLGCYLWGTGCPVTAGGDTYSKTMTMTGDTATRFETAAKTLRDARIRVETNPMLMGKTTVVVFPVAINTTIELGRLDIATLYFKNAGAGDNGKITILGVED